MCLGDPVCLVCLGDPVVSVFRGSSVFSVFSVFRKEQLDMFERGIKICSSRRRKLR